MRRRKIEIGDLNGVAGRMVERLRAENLPRARALDDRKRELTELAAARREAAESSDRATWPGVEPARKRRRPKASK